LVKTNKQRIVKRSAQTVDSLKGTFQSNHKIELQMEIILVRIFSFLFAEKLNFAAEIENVPQRDDHEMFCLLQRTKLKPCEFHRG